MCPPVETWACDEVLDRLEAYLDRDLGPSDERAVADHLRDCASCARELTVAEAIRSELRALPEYEAPSRVLWAARTGTGPESGRERVRAVAGGWLSRPSRTLAAAASVLVVVGVAALWSLRSTPRPSLDDPEIARAARETRYAFALVGALGRRAALEELLGDRVVAPTVRRLSRSLGTLSLNNEERSGAVTENVEIEGSQG